MSDLISDLHNADDQDPHDQDSLIQNICISDAATGHIIFERVYKWKETAAFSNLGSLIQVFYQFAREVDNGVISSIKFESGGRNTKKKRNDILQSDDKDTMQMTTIKTKDIIVSIFYDMRGSMLPSPEHKLKLNVLIHCVKTLFERKFLTELMENRGTFHHDSSVSESQAITNSSFLSAENETGHTLKSFESFTTIADQLKVQIFPPEDGAIKNSAEIQHFQALLLRPGVSLEEHVNGQVAHIQL